MKIRVKPSSIDAGGKTIGIINEHDAVVMGVHPLDKVVVWKGKKSITVTIDTTKSFVKQGSMVVFKEVCDFLRLKNNEIVDAVPMKSLASSHYIKKKTDGEELKYEEYEAIVHDVIARNLNEIEISSFITALYIRGMTLDESIHMSKSMIASGKTIKFPGTVVDKHSIGGVPGDKTSMMAVPIIAAMGLTIPKTSSRSITSPAGTADRMEVLAPVALGIDEIKRVVSKTGGCLVWGGAVDLSPADDLFIRIEHPIGLDPLLLPSVMSKKKAVGSKYLVIDIPTGPGAKILTKEEAERLAANFIALGKELDMKVDCAITRGDQPVGYAIGPALEAREVLQNMKSMESKDLIDKATSVAGVLLSMVGKGDKKTAETVIKSGAAERKLREIIAAQGGDPKIKAEDIVVGPCKFNVCSASEGVISAINNHALVEICQAAGTPKDKGAGMLLSKKIGDAVKKGDVLFTIYSEKSAKLNAALKMAKSQDIYTTLTGKRTMLVEKIGK
ncbi:MAG TPA: AMP phosphorylase [archaeon]|nr:AMP phosphorylase [archaeon]